MRVQVARWGAVVAMVCAGASFAQAQTAVGKSAVEGRVIELLSDKTWRFADDTGAPSECQNLPLDLSFCGTSSGWTEVDPPSPEIAAQYHYNDRHYGQFVTEAVGSDDGISVAFFLKVVITNAATAAGIPDKDVVVLGVEDDEVDGQPAETITYQLAIDGLEVVFVNTIVVLPRRSFQIMTFSVGKTMSDEHQALHREFLGHTQIK